MLVFFYRFFRIFATFAMSTKAVCKCRASKCKIFHEPCSKCCNCNRKMVSRKNRKPSASFYVMSPFVESSLSSSRTRSASMTLPSSALSSNYPKKAKKDMDTTTICNGVTGGGNTETSRLLSANSTTRSIC